MLGSIAEARDLIVVERYASGTVGEKETILLAIECQSRSLWQAMCESSFVAGAEVFQAHVAVAKLNRKGHCQERFLVLSTSWLYNVECHMGPISVKQAKVTVKRKYPNPNRPQFVTASPRAVGHADPGYRRAAAVGGPGSALPDGRGRSH